MKAFLRSVPDELVAALDRAAKHMERVVQHLKDREKWYALEVELHDLAQWEPEHIERALDGVRERGWSPEAARTVFLPAAQMSADFKRDMAKVKAIINMAPPEIDRLAAQVRRLAAGEAE